MRRVAFVVGRSDHRSTTVLILRVQGGPILGPWTLRALISSN